MRSPHGCIHPKVWLYALARVSQTGMNAPPFEGPAIQPGDTKSAPGGSMTAQDRPTGSSLPNDDVVAVSDEALQKAEAFIEADEGAANRLMGWAGRISTTIAVVMSLFHLYAAYAIVPTQELRYTHVAFTL